MLYKKQRDDNDDDDDDGHDHDHELFATFSVDVFGHRNFDFLPPNQSVYFPKENCTRFPFFSVRKFFSTPLLLANQY